MKLEILLLVRERGSWKVCYTFRDNIISEDVVFTAKSFYEDVSIEVLRYNPKTFEYILGA